MQEALIKRPTRLLRFLKIAEDSRKKSKFSCYCILTSIARLNCFVLYGFGKTMQNPYA